MNRGEAGDHPPSPALLTAAPRPGGKVHHADASLGSDARSSRPSKLLNGLLALRPLSALSDERLVEMTRAGSERAFETLASRYRRQLLIYAERMLGTESRAEDALQQALLQAWVALRGGAEVAEPRPWLYRIVHNCAVSIVRRPRHDCVALSDELDAAADSTSESRLLLGEIFDHLAVMPEPQRDAIVMTAIAGRSHEEAAAALGLTDGAVRGLVYRARSALRRAAAAVFPVGLWTWIGRRQSLAGDAADAAGAAGAVGSAGLAAAVVKGGAVVVTAGVIAGAGHGLLTDSTTPRHPQGQAAHRVLGVHARVGGRHARSGLLLPAAVAASQVTIAEHRDGNHDRSRDSGERGRGSGGSGSSNGGGDGGHGNGSSGEGPGPSSSGGSGGGGPGPSPSGGGGGGPGPSSSGGSGGGPGPSPSGGSGGGPGPSPSGGGGRSGPDISAGSSGPTTDGGGGSSGGPAVTETAAATLTQPAPSGSTGTSGPTGSGGPSPSSSSDGTSGGSGAGGSSGGPDGGAEPGGK